MYKRFGAAVVVAFLFLGCSLSEGNGGNCAVVIGVPTTAVTGPTETQVDTQIVLEVSYTAKANCGGFVSFFQPPGETPFVDVITVNTEYDACSCDQVESVQKVNYPFKRSTAGTYLLKFKKSNDTYVEHTVVVE